MTSESAEVLLLWDDVSTSAHDLFDCWGVRDPSRPIVSMTEAQWLQSDDVPLMLRWFRQEWQGEERDLDRLLQRYLLACCRKIWSLLAMEGSRQGVEVAELYLEGKATREEFARAEWKAEGAAYFLEPSYDSLEFEDPEAREAHTRYIAEKQAHNDLLVKEFEAIPPEERLRLVQPTGDDAPASLLELLSSAAYFADAAMTYPGSRPKEAIERYQHFLSAPLLREVVGNPFRSRSDHSPM